MSSTANGEQQDASDQASTNPSQAASTTSTHMNNGISVTDHGREDSSAATSITTDKRARITDEDDSEDDTPKGPFELVFKTNDKVWVTHGPLMYEAKVLDTDINKGYFIHYQGWKSKWDEWVEPKRVADDSEASREKAKQLKREILAKANSNGSGNTGGSASGKRSASNASSGNNPGGAPKKRKDLINSDDQEDVPEDEGVEAVAHVKLNLSEDLKTIVVRDWEQLTQNKHICSLPKAEDKTVERIVQDFVASKKTSQVFAQIGHALLIYFDRALPQILLYRVEKPQLEKLKQSFPDKRSCQLYGGEHLLRLFVRLPQLLASTDLDETETKQLCSRLQDLLKFLAKRTNDYFPPDNEGYTDNVFLPTDEKSVK